MRFHAVTVSSKLSMTDSVRRISPTPAPTCGKLYEGRSESKERLAIQRYLLIIGKKQNMQVLSHTFIYFST